MHFYVYSPWVRFGVWCEAHSEGWLNPARVPAAIRSWYVSFGFRSIRVTCVSFPPTSTEFMRSTAGHTHEHVPESKYSSGNHFCSWLIKKYEQWMSELTLVLSLILCHRPSGRICLLFHLYYCSLSIQSSNRAEAMSHAFVIQLKIPQTCMLPS